MLDASMEKQLLDMLPENLRAVVKVVGIETAIKLVKNFGGTLLSIPKCDQLIKEARNQRIRKEYDSGKTLSEIARKYNLNQRQVRRLLKTESEPMPDSILKLLEGLA